jgi:hypothetical protein
VTQYSDQGRSRSMDVQWVDSSNVDTVRTQRTQLRPDHHGTRVAGGPAPQAGTWRPRQAPALRRANNPSPMTPRRSPPFCAVLSACCALYVHADPSCSRSRVRHATGRSDRVVNTATAAASRSSSRPVVEARARTHTE